MLTRIFFIILLIITFIFYIYKKKNKSNILMLLIIIVLSLIFAYREFILPSNMLGTDYYEYKRWFDVQSFSNIFSNFKYENFAFDILICITKFLDLDFYFFLFICSLIINIGIIFFIKRYSTKFSLSLFIYIILYYTSTFNIMRQWIACSIFLLAFKYIVDKKIIKYVCMIIIASLFHTTAIILLLIYPFLQETIIKEKIFILTVTIVIAMTITILIPQIDNIILNIAGKFGSNYATKYANYVGYYSNYTNVVLGIIALVIITLYRHIKGNENPEYSNVIYIFLFLYTILGILATKSFIINRLMIYFVPSFFIGFPYVLKLFKNKQLIIQITIYMLLFSIIIIERLLV